MARQKDYFSKLRVDFKPDGHQETEEMKEKGNYL